MLFPVLGSLPSGDRAERIKRSPNYRDGSFQNLTPTEVTLPGTSFFKMMGKFLAKPKSTEPPKSLPSVKTDLRTLSTTLPTIVWFGHSSYYISYQGFTMLVDPVFSGNASPVSFFAKAFEGADVYDADDFDAVDVLLITHDHYDHMDYKTILAMAPKVGVFCTSLGVGAHLEAWGIPADKIAELDWQEHVSLVKGASLTAMPARHFSGRSFKRGQSLWSSFVLQLPGYTLFLGGDSGYEAHFRAIGELFGPFDIALLEAGQYGDEWPFIHTTPEETVKAAADLKAKVLLPVHWAKFSLSVHSWDDPIRRVVQAAKDHAVTIATPKIGEPVILGEQYPADHWWEL